MTVSVSRNVTRLRELDEVVDEDEVDGVGDGMKKSNSVRQWNNQSYLRS